MIRNVPYTLYVLENIGLTLLLSVAKGGASKADESRAIGVLLERSVQLAHAMEKKLGVKPGDDNFLENKLMLAGLACKIVAARYQAEGEIIFESAFDNILQGLEIILSQSENFNFQAEFENNRDTFDALSSVYSSALFQHVSDIEALAPILEPISEFSFGLDDSKAIQFVSNNLLARAKALNLRLMGNFPDSERESLAGRGILKILAAIYAQAHTAQTRNILAMDERIRQQNTSQITIDMVWRDFERKCVLLEVLIEGLMPAEKEDLPLSEEDLDIDEILQQPVPISVQAQPSPLSFYKKVKKT